MEKDFFLMPPLRLKSILIKKNKKTKNSLHVFIQKDKYNKHQNKIVAAVNLMISLKKNQRYQDFVIFFYFDPNFHVRIAVVIEIFLQILLAVKWLKTRFVFFMQGFKTDHVCDSVIQCQTV